MRVVYCVQLLYCEVVFFLMSNDHFLNHRLCRGQFGYTTVLRINMHAHTHVVCRRVKTPNLSSPPRPVRVREIVVIKRQLINYLEKRIITTTSSLHIHARARVYVERRKLERENGKIAAKVENKIKNNKNNYVTKVAWENIVLFYIFLCRGSRYRARAVHYYTQAYYISRVYIIYYRGYNTHSLI